MTAAVPTRSHIFETIDQLPPEKLVQLWEFIEQLTTKGEEVPLYRIHEQAVSTGIHDLAEEHDHYLYGAAKHDA
jgi:hypothetical protein